MKHYGKYFLVKIRFIVIAPYRYLQYIKNISVGNAPQFFTLHLSLFIINHIQV